MDTMEMNWGTLSDPIFEHALTRPDALALVQRDTRLTYAALARQISQAAIHLQSLGIAPGDVIAVSLGFGIDAVVLTLALLRLGAVPVDIAGIRPDALAVPIARFQVRRILAPSMIDLPEGVICHPVDAAFHAATAALGGDRRQARDPAAIHLLHLAADRRGAPKAIAVTQHQMLARMRTARLLYPDIFAPGPPPVLLLSGGLGFAAMTLMATQFALGRPTGLLPPDLEAPRLARLIEGAGDAVALVSETLCRKFLALAPAQGLLFPKLRGLLHTTAILTADEQSALTQRLAAKAWSLRGTPATGFVAAHLPGPIAPGIWAEAADGAGHVLPPATIGHLRFRGPGVSHGLFRAPPAEQTAEGFHNGWYSPGEIGTISATFALAITGQTADLLRRRGTDIHVPHLEAVLRAHPGTSDAAVVAIIPPDTKDPLLIAFAVAKGEPDMQGLAKHCASALPATRRPDRLAAIAQIPRLADGSIDRRKLATLAIRGEASKAKQ
jgi:acyl-CoA synthetase (AMP-forming)/AMP-acid ligase II